jgi:hypothetical protein
MAQINSLPKRHVVVLSSSVLFFHMAQYLLICQVEMTSSALASLQAEAASGTILLRCQVKE